MSVPGVIGVAGAGTMGAGIAQLAIQAGARTVLYDPAPGGLERGVAALAKRGLAPAVTTGDVAGFQGCELVIEAAPESLQIKAELFGAIAEVVSEGCVLATNTSSLSVTALAARVPGRERVVGMHFFNPAPVMKLLEVVPGDESSEAAIAVAHAAGEAMGKHVIQAADVPGFIVNRCNRPFSLEALRIVQERLAAPAEVDASMRAGGFRMGPFELMDLVGLDVGLEVAKSFYEQSFGEPRWRPSPLVAHLVAAGRHGRKTGRGWYEYPPGPPSDTAPSEEILERIVCQLVNEAHFALGEGIGSAADIDDGMVLGLNHPRGPFAWGDELGLEQVVRRLDELWERHREERYRVAPLLRQTAAAL